MHLLKILAFSDIRPCLCIFNENDRKNQHSPDLIASLNNLTLESVIDVGQGISVGPGRFGKKNKRRAWNKRRAPYF